MAEQAAATDGMETARTRFEQWRNSRSRKSPIPDDPPGWITTEPPKVTEVRTWLTLRPRYHVHYTPDQCPAWKSHGRSITREGDAGLLGSTQQNPKPIVWNANADLISGKIVQPLNVVLTND